MSDVLIVDLESPIPSRTFGDGLPELIFETAHPSSAIRLLGELAHIFSKPPSVTS